MQPEPEDHPSEGRSRAGAVHTKRARKGHVAVAVAPSIGRAAGCRGSRCRARLAGRPHALTKRHADRVLEPYCTGHMRDRNGRPEDALQSHAPSWHALRSPSTRVVPEIELAWLLSIARNVCLTRWNTNRRRGEREITRDPLVLQEVAPCRESEGEELFRLQEALEAMPERERRAILLREWQGLSYRESQQSLGPASPRLRRSSSGPVECSRTVCAVSGAEQAPRCARSRSQLAAGGAQVAPRWRGRQGRGGRGCRHCDTLRGCVRAECRTACDAPSPEQRPSQRLLHLRKTSSTRLARRPRDLAGELEDDAQRGASEQAPPLRSSTHARLWRLGAGCFHGRHSCHRLAGVEQVATTVLPVVVEAAPAIVPVVVEAPAAVLQAGELALAPLPGAPVVSLP